MDSRVATYEHIGEVRRRLALVITDLVRRQDEHDASKLASPEREAFDEAAPKLAGTIYGSDEYRAALAGMRPALDHHYAANSHHPEHYRWHCAACNGSFSAADAPESNWGGGETHRFCPRCVGAGSVIWEAELMDRPDLGVRGMSLLDVVEMLVDWKAATLRHHDGDIRRSIDLNQKRFGYSDDLRAILLNTLPLIE